MYLEQHAQVPDRLLILYPVKLGCSHERSDAKPMAIGAGASGPARASESTRLLIISKIASRRGRSITSVLRELSIVHGIPISTLKLNAAKLRELGIIDFGSKGEERPALLSDEGFAIIRKFGENNAKGKRRSERKF